MTTATSHENSDRAPCADMPSESPGQEHEWLQQFVGEWDLELEIDCGPGRSPMKSRGHERARIFGGFWLESEGRNEDFPYVCRLMLGYDRRQRCYVGTWMDSMSSHLWHYRGTVDATGRILTLETEGPFPPGPDGGLSKFREVTEFKSKDHRVFTSSRWNERGEWQQMVRIDFRRRASA
ncbi:conserved hypothetical protein [Opitutus terrae PB90-1]|uniref:DUF1579 domain-containing protein n=2 Tax=Opitutus terrae TaxID=107709 RepID=B1ZU56_OPITP|nr:conserved hypothetical protein [Opitutus terrae PB90-1]